MKLYLIIILLSATLLLNRRHPESGFRFEFVGGESLKLWEGGKPVLVYNYGMIQPSGQKGAIARSCYIHPIYGLDGEILTDDFPADHVHHRGLYWAWPHIKVGGREVDLWNLNGIRIEFRRWKSKKADSNSATLALENSWIVDDEAVMKEEITFKMHKSEPESRAMDLNLKWTPLGRPITLQGSEGKSYGGLNLRFGPRKTTVIATPEGRSKEDLLMTNLKWADLSGDLAESGKISGAAVFVHPKNPDYPPTWMTRHYGLLSVGWPGVTAKTFRPGIPIHHRYRIWIHRGNPESKEMGQAYSSFVTRVK